ncbi:helix-turn-helix domain-containing protein [Plantactinospora soyae]|uniref:Transcriptional regulator with XRE-family HTH domain n=1 Tax=Plantactinospora soyae TaxID=1544732 RepID=A0A927M8C9_9ACTN|nr:helix-turn-helix transcriptional regulator [Plantactinospora soyae]MBE1488561.1 transcriptional regulator with XRE-family HTH domain [Plantactinospora soyae]
MADEPTPTADLIRAQLRRMRATAGLSQEEYGKRAHYSASMVSAVELGQRPLDEVYLARADKVFGTGDLFVSLLKLAARDGEPTWFRPWLEAERAAKQLRCFEPMLIPGLLQTEDYARAVIRGDVTLTDDEVNALVASRLARQAILDREHPPQVTAVLDESALHRFTEESATVMAGQLTHLITFARQPNVSVHVIPTKVGLHIGLSGSFVLARSDDGGWVGHLDNQLGGTVVDHTEEVEVLLARWESVRNVALPTWQSVELIEEVMKPWTT